MTANMMIRVLEISRFRGIRSLLWRPAAGMNIIVGGGDVGKTTVLDAIALLLSPSNSFTVSEADFWMRETTEEFSISAVIGIPATSGISTQSSFAWPWEWDGKDAILPGAAESGSGISDPVYKIRVRGTPGLEIAWEILQPNDQQVHLSVAVRRQIGLVRLSASDQNDRDLRLVYGSGLDRLFGDSALRSRIGRQVAQLSLVEALGSDGTKAIKELGARLERESLPSNLSIGLTTSQGLSIGALIGLLAKKGEVDLPLASWGSGTRRMTSLEICATTQNSASVTVVDEIERGLEPYRLRKLLAKLQVSPGQSFLTTHSPVAISCAYQSSLWHIDGAGNIGELPQPEIHDQQRRDPETFLARMPIIVEGSTEVGFLRFVLERAFPSTPADFGIRVCDGQGNPNTLGLLTALSKSGVHCFGLADNEGKSPGRWEKLKESMGDRLLQWNDGCTEKVVIEAIPEEKLWQLLNDSDGDISGARLRTISDRLEIESKERADIEAEIADRPNLTLRQLIIGASSGSTDGAPLTKSKEWKSHGKNWFKSEEGGRELAAKMVALGGSPSVSQSLLPLVNAILAGASLSRLEQLDLERQPRRGPTEIR